jgi:hypothetical protein
MPHVSFNNAGRFGNWYLECATAIAYALQHNLNFHASDGHGKDPHWNPVYCLHLCDKTFNPNIETIRLWENGHYYQPLEFREEWRNKNIVIEGYRQSEKYFKDYRQEILFLLDFPYQKKDGYVALHVRRGDYVHLVEKHPQVTPEWYKKAVDNYFPDKKIKVFSDDIPYCKKVFADRDWEYSANHDILSDFIEMQNCEHFVNSSSTFSWAAAWHSRSEGKMVVTPEDWFVKGYSLETKDIIPESWIKLPL